MSLFCRQFDGLSLYLASEKVELSTISGETVSFELKAI